MIIGDQNEVTKAVLEAMEKTPIRACARSWCP